MRDSRHRPVHSAPPLPASGEREERAARTGLKAAYVFAALSVLLCLATTASAQTVEDFYRGRQLNLIVGYGPGGGYDITARLLARYLGKYIPGNPNIVVQNMAGAGSMRAANYLYVSAPRDGSTF